ncbi:MAG: DNA repair protein RecO [Syntrophothermus sp.]
MSEIIKTEAIVLSKLNFRESSTIVTFYTRALGKVSAMIKGARSAKSMIGMKADILNLIQIVIYSKKDRELQLVTQAELISHYPQIKSDLEKLKYASAVVELVQAFTVEEEVNERLFKGITRILDLFETSNENGGSLLVKFILFLIKETGFEIHIDSCPVCGNELPHDRVPLYNFERGLICDDCINNLVQSSVFPKELFKLMLGLRNNKSATLQDQAEIEKVLVFLENYLKYHMPSFKGIRSIHLF